jgi:hypothetical protein
VLNTLPIFLLIFLLKVIPAFARPTMLYHSPGFRFLELMAVTSAFVGAAAARLGRFTLAGRVAFR